MVERYLRRTKRGHRMGEKNHRVTERYEPFRSADTALGRTLIAYSVPVRTDKMKIFISWSGSRERVVAEALKKALIATCAGRVEVFVSSADIAKGDRGLSVIDARLKDSDYGIIVLSSTNQGAQWINYEGGALAKTLDTRVATLLMDMVTSDVEGPLQNFQATRFCDEADVHRMFREIALAADPDMPEESIGVLFSNHWPTLQRSWQTGPSESAVPRRSNEDMLAELINRVRDLDARVGSRATQISRRVFRQPPAADAIKLLRAATSGSVTLNRVEVTRSGINVELREVEPTDAAGVRRAFMAIRDAFPEGDPLITYQPLLPLDPLDPPVTF